MAPYASSEWAGGHSYAEFMKMNGNSVDFLALQYYNQALYHDDLEQVFLKSGKGSWAPGSAIAELIDFGVPASKLLVGKPLDTPSGFRGW